MMCRRKSRVYPTITFDETSTFEPAPFADLFGEPDEDLFPVRKPSNSRTCFLRFATTDNPPQWPIGVVCLRAERNRAVF